MGNLKTLVVLDDDPTGTQTVHDVEVLTEWLVLHAFSMKLNLSCQHKRYHESFIEIIGKSLA